MKQVPLVLLGFGKVGQALARLIEQRNGFADTGARLFLRAVFDRGGAAIGESLQSSELIDAKCHNGSVASHPRCGRPGMAPAEALAADPSSILIDASPTDPEFGQPGLDPICQALEQGHSVVLASKGPLVAAYEKVASLAVENKCRVGISAAVGTPLPSVETVLLGLHGSSVCSFRGLFNETSNRILREMEAGASREQAVESARKAGVLESDPRLDLEGWDTLFKVLILARVFWDPALPADSARVEGITGISPEELSSAREKGRRVRLLGSARRDDSGEVEIQVQPVALDETDPLFPLGAGEKGAVFESDLMGRFVIRSGKAGPFATAAAVVKDVLNIAVHPAVLAI